MRIIQVGVHGYGQVHLQAIEPLEQAGRAQLVAAVDPKPGDFRRAPTYDDLASAIAAHGADIVSIAAPIGAHAALATVALQHGADVLLEKPPTASLAEFRDLLATAQETGRAVQVGFQTLGSPGIGILQRAVADGVVGADPRVVAWGLWSRDVGYYARSAWAGRRVLGGARVADGAVTNPLAHSVSAALAVAGASRDDQVEWVDTELYRVHDIDTDDTAWLAVGTTSGVPIQAALTLAAPAAPYARSSGVSLVGEAGRVDFFYSADQIRWRLAGSPEHIDDLDKQCLLTNLVDHREQGTPLLAPLDESGGFMCVLEASQTSPAPTRIGPDHVEWVGSGPTRAPILRGIADAVEAAVSTGQPWSSLGVPWATAAPVRWRPQSPLA